MRSGLKVRPGGCAARFVCVVCSQLLRHAAGLQADGDAAAGEPLDDLRVARARVEQEQRLAQPGHREEDGRDAREPRERSALDRHRGRVHQRHRRVGCVWVPNYHLPPPRLERQRGVVSDQPRADKLHQRREGLRDELSQPARAPLLWGGDDVLGVAPPCDEEREAEEKPGPTSGLLQRLVQDVPQLCRANLP